MVLASGEPPPGTRVTPLVPRICHWLNALALFIMIGSGWRIYDTWPVLPNLLPYIPYRLTLGGNIDLSYALHGESGFAGALMWHFTGMWLLVVNFVAWLGHGLLSGRFRRRLLPIRPRAVVRDLGAALRLRLAHEVGVYNAVQRLLYVGVLGLIALAILSGLAIWKPVQFQALTWLLGGFDSARVVHFLCMAGIVGFLVVHLALVVLVPRSLAAMITGGGRP
jgi:thiosulfate reductase cytochrome b subunit